MQKPGVSYRKRCRKGPKSKNRLKKSEKKRTFYLKTRNKVVFLAELDGLALRDARNRILRSWITIVWPKIDFGIRVSVFRQLNGDFTCKSLTTLCFFAKSVFFRYFNKISRFHGKPIYIWNQRAILSILASFVY